MRFLAILGFHKIGVPPRGSWETWLSIPEATFVGYLSYLEKNGWQVIDLAAFLAGLEVPESLPGRAALLTFDDAYRSVRETASACLRRFGYPAVLFVPTDFIGGRNWLDVDTDEPEEDLCSWDDLRELERSGFSVLGPVPRGLAPAVFQARPGRARGGAHPVSGRARGRARETRPGLRVPVWGLGGEPGGRAELAHAMNYSSDASPSRQGNGRGEDTGSWSPPA